MISKKTVLILGAGASVPYGYPSGEELRMLIYNDITGIYSTTILKKIGFNEAKIMEFRNEFLDSGQYTIDEFLEKRDTFTNIGKIAIVLQLIPRERNNQMNMIQDSINWYKLVFNKMNTEFNSFHENQVSFITFNYDRSLEQYLFNALKSSSGAEPNKVAEVLKKINIIHLYGQMGFLPWQDTPGRNYGSIDDTNLIEMSAQGIKIIRDDIHKDKEFSKAHELLQEAEKIYFLGFGFNPTNLRRLNIYGLSLNKEIAGTSIGLSKHDIVDIHDNSLLKIKPRNLIATNIVKFFSDNFRLE